MSSANPRVRGSQNGVRKKGEEEEEVLVLGTGYHVLERR